MPKFDRRLLTNFDWLLFGLVMLISIIGIATIYSATRPPIETGVHPDFYLRQILWLVISVFALFFVVFFDYIWLHRFSYVMYGLGILLLVIVLIAGKSTMGAQRWLNIGFCLSSPLRYSSLYS